MSLRYFKEKMPKLAVIAAGSLLEFALRSPVFKMPVGRIHFLYLEPVSFSKYLDATGNQKLRQFLSEVKLTDSIDDVIHKKLLELLRAYLITRNRGSPVIKKFLGILLKGILTCNFWGAYSKISSLAKQRCFYHLFTELVKVDHHNQSNQWKVFRKKLSRLLKDAIRLSEKKNQVSPERFLRLKKGDIIGLNSF